MKNLRVRGEKNLGHLEFEVSYSEITTFSPLHRGFFLAKLSEFDYIYLLPAFSACLPTPGQIDRLKLGKEGPKSGRSSSGML